MITLVDYGMGNVGSILNAINKIGGEAMVSDDPTRIAEADALILPGVGAFDTAMRTLRERGLTQALETCVVQRGRPILGICLGMQVLGSSSEEGELPGLGWLDAKCVRFRSTNEDFPIKIPNMGWKEIAPIGNSELFRGMEGPIKFYFVHSYHLVCQDHSAAIATAYHGEVPFTCAVQQENIFGVQFHPEKSHKFGLGLLKRFWDHVVAGRN